MLVITPWDPTGHGLGDFQKCTCTQSASKIALGSPDMRGQRGRGGDLGQTAAFRGLGKGRTQFTDIQDNEEEADVDDLPDLFMPCAEVSVKGAKYAASNSTTQPSLGDTIVSPPEVSSLLGLYRCTSTNKSTS